MKDPVVSVQMAAFHATVIGMQLMVIGVVYAIRSKMTQKYAQAGASGSSARLAKRGWSLLLAATTLMLGRRLGTIMILAEWVPRDIGRQVSWVLLPLLVTMLMLMGFYDILMCHELCPETEAGGEG